MHSVCIIAIDTPWSLEPFYVGVSIHRCDPWIEPRQRREYLDPSVDGSKNITVVRPRTFVRFPDGDSISR